MNSASSLVVIHAHTPLHAGTGAALGTIDLPIQRERHTAWPNIAASSIKGVLRDSYRRSRADDVDVLFGPDTDAASDHAGALSFTDARILAFPVRSMCGVYALVTCPAVLTRLKEDLRIIGNTALPDVPSVKSSEAMVLPGSPLIVDGSTIILEEYDCRVRTDGADPMINALALLASTDVKRQQELTPHLAIIGDDDFTYFVQHCTQVDARVALEYDTKTVREGALFYEEFLPAESLLYFLLLASPSLKRGSERDANGVGAAIIHHLRSRPIHQIGAGQTIGKGICSLTVSGGVQ